MSRFIIIGDVHGCLPELDELLAALDLREGDRVGFVGDFLDRGPDSPGCVRRARELTERFPGSLAVCGNHEEKWLRYRHHGRDLPNWAERVSDADWDWLESLPPVAYAPDWGVVLVHGGFTPSYLEQYERVGAIPADWRQNKKDKRIKRMHQFLRVRRVDESGQMLPLRKAHLSKIHWSDVYDGREGYCFFGHDPQLDPPEVLRAPHAMGLDTGCCFGGRLTAAVLEPGVPPSEARLVSVAAHGQYAQPLRLQG